MVTALPTANETATPEDRQGSLQPGFGKIYKEWVCNNYGGGGGHAQLRRSHQGFNRVFGGAKLTAAPLQCYSGECNGYYFTVCNWAGVNRAETPNMRNIAADRDPGADYNCLTTNYENEYIKYYWGRGTFDSSFARTIDRRRC